MNSKCLGDFGEELAAKYLHTLGYTILEKNYKVKIGEIDIIACDQKTLVFVEVKTRSSSIYGMPSQAVNFHKQQKILKTAQWYLNQTNQNEKICRFDIIEVLREKETYRINQIKNAFEAN